MNNLNQFFSKPWIITLASVVLVALGILMWGHKVQGSPAKGQESPAPISVGGVQITGVPDDWTHHHVVFSDPGPEYEASRNGMTYDEWLRIASNPRYIMQQLKRRTSARGPAAGDVAGIEEAARTGGAITALQIGTDPVTSALLPSPLAAKARKSKLTKDWSVPLLTGAVLPNTYPAKWTFTTTNTPSCSGDYAVYPTGSTGSGTAASIVAYHNLYATTCTTGTVPSVYWAYNTGAAAVTTSPVLSGDGTELAFIQSNGTTASLVLLKWAQTPATITTAKGSVSSSNTSVTATTGITAADVGMQIKDTTNTGCIPANDTIAAFSGTTVTLATATSASCGTHTGDSLTLTTEAVATPGAAPTVSASAYPNCTAPCMYSVALNGSPNDTYSSPYYDYDNDVLYVGDNSSYLHKFTGVFNGTPTEVTKVQLNTTAYDVASPTADPTSGCVFVGDSEGYFYSVSSGVAGTVCTSTTFGTFGHSEILGDGAANEGIFDAPLVDSTAGEVYAFITDSATITSCAAGHNCIVQFATNKITSGSTTAAPTAEEPLGTGGANYNMYAGAFDNVYYSSTSSSRSGSIYAVGNTNSTSGTLYQVTISSNAMTAVTSKVTGLGGNGAEQPWPSPVTEFCNNGANPCVSSGTATTTGTDYIFFSVYQGTTGSCTASPYDAGCVYAYTVDSPSTVTLSSSMQLTFPGGIFESGCWGTGAFIIDNSSTSTGASQVYFINLDGNSPSTTPSTCTSGTGKTIDATQAQQSAL